MKTLKKLHSTVRKWVEGRSRRQRHSFRPGMGLLEDRRVLSAVAGAPSVVSYNSGLYAFARESDGHLHVAATGGSSTTWQDVGQPAATVTVAGDPSAVVYSPNNELDAFVRGSDNHLWRAYSFNGSTWNWADLTAQPGGVTVAGKSSAVFYSASNGMYDFVQGTNGHLYMAYYLPSSGWNWQDHTAMAGGVSVANDPSAVYCSSNNGLYAFVQGTNGHLALNYYIPALGWHWQDHGTPPATGVTIAGAPGAVANSAGTQVYAFAQGSDGHLYLNYCLSGSWYWQDHGTPNPSAPNVTVASAPSAVVYSPNSEMDVFVRGSDGHLYQNYSFGSTWNWIDNGAPLTSGVTAAGTPSAVSYGSNNGLYAFTQGSDGELYDTSYLPGSSWEWETRGALHPVAATPYSPVPTSSNLYNSSGSPSYTDVQQGAEGDCWLIASLAETAARAPTDITAMFTNDGTILENGAPVTIYTVRLYDSAGMAHYVTVDTELPSSNGMYTYDEPVGGALWAALAEKAYAEANGAGYVTSGNMGTNSYDALNNGFPSWALQAITGKAAGYTPLSSNGLTTGWQSGSLMVLGTNTTTTAINSVNIVPSHAYAVVGYNATTQQFTLFNPWGVNGGTLNQVFYAGSVTATEPQLATDFGWEFYGSGAAPGAREGHHTASPQALADLAFIEGLLDAHSNDRRGGAGVPRADLVGL
jgi:hypothetical protein